MSPLELCVVALGTTAALLLPRGPARGRTLRRLERLRSPTAPPPRPVRARLRRALLLWGAPSAPALTLLAVFGPAAAVLIGVPIGAALRWRLTRGDGPAAPRTERARMSAGLPVAVDLIVAGLRAGGAMEDVVASVAKAVGGTLGRALGGVAEQLRLGADPRTAWRSAQGPEEFEAVGRALARASDSGTPVATILQRHAAELRDAARARVLSRTQRLGVLSAAPLGLCFLPAFVLIGVVPLAAGLISDLALL
ncbi:type II secretion system F family protein [Streptomonospora litoralis]|uniref:Bacterial type II secretion system protein F domain protein n=1 Tax=Streptomonospora litoralis TaxID=2498135 RepID=A0A4V0ZJ23_9ACTN|nr:type II secretion system F family protein [Streptomonospora litoralis]QBI51982.1 Bacterial type II secretion system protein F domain protein [Streptomonospora litoralis]